MNPELDATQELGLTADQLQAIKQVLVRHPLILGALVFGSRALGRQVPASDVDLALEGRLSALQAEAVASELDEAPFPLHFDVVALEAVTSQALLEHIRRVGVRIWPLSPSLDAKHAADP